MHANLAEIMAEAHLHERTVLPIEWLPRQLECLIHDRRRGVEGRRLD
jgi:hypothetical protein